MPINEDDIQFAESVIRKAYERRNIPFDMDDLISEGMVGLIDAIKRHKEKKGKRKTFLHCRIVGAVQDYLRYRFLHGGTRHIKLEMVPLRDFMDSPLLSVDGTEQRIANKQVWELIRKTLEPKKTIMLGLYFFDGYTKKEIGGLFNLTESRICQITKEALGEVEVLLEDEL